MSKLNLGIVFGGKSTEHEVSRASATSIIKNVNKEKYNIYLIGITKEGKWKMFEGDIEKITTGEWEKEGTTAFIAPDSEIKGIVKLVNNTYEIVKLDVVFPVLHWLYGEDGTIQGLFELAGIPYVGPGVLASSVGMDKVYTKIILKDKGIPQCNFIWVTKKDINSDIEKIISDVESNIGYPCFVKPSNSGSSIGVSKAHDRKELTESLKNACRYDKKVLIEEFIDGRELECSVLGNEDPKASIVGEIIPVNEFYDYEAKYIKEGSKICIPAEIDEEVSNMVRDLAIKAYKAIDAKGFSRVDFFLHRQTGKVYVNEINTIPGFTNISMYPKLWEQTGIEYSELIDKLIELALDLAE